MVTFFNGKPTCPMCMKAIRPVKVRGNMVTMNCECGLSEEVVKADVKIIKVNKQEFNQLGKVLDAVKNNMKPTYQFVFDEFGNVIFLDYSEYGSEYSNYSYRWVWSKLKEGPNKGEWYLIPFPQFHPKSLDLLPFEMELAKKAYEDIKIWENQNKQGQE